MTVARDIVMDLYTNFAEPSEIALADFLKENCHIRESIIGRLLNGDTITGPTKEKLAEGFSAMPGCGTILKAWFDLPSVDAFNKKREQHKTATTKLEIEVPRSGTPALLENIVGDYVTYRYAFDIASGGTEVSREFLTLKRDGDRLKFKMYYRVTGKGEKAPPLVYDGYACVVGGSVMAMAVSIAQRGPDHEDVSRGRYLTFAHTVEKNNPENDQDLKFGILTSTRIEMHEPCSACIVMFKIKGRIKNLRNFCDKIAVVQQWDEFKSSDFGKFPVTKDFNIQADMEVLMKNVPRKDDHYDDKVLRLHYFERFKTIRSRILFVAKNTKGFSAPWTRGGIAEMTAKSRTKKKTRKGGSGGGAPPALAA